MCETRPNSMNPYLFVVIAEEEGGGLPHDIIYSTSIHSTQRSPHPVLPVPPCSDLSGHPPEVELSHCASQSPHNSTLPSFDTTGKSSTRPHVDSPRLSVTCSDTDSLLPTARALPSPCLSRRTGRAEVRLRWTLPTFHPLVRAACHSPGRGGRGGNTNNSQWRVFFFCFYALT